MDRRADRNILQRQGIAAADRCFRTRHDLVTRLDTTRRQNVPALTIRIKKQRQVGTSVRVMLNPLDPCADSVLGAKQVNKPIAPLVATTTMTHRYAPMVVTTADAALTRYQPTERLALVQAWLDDPYGEPATG